MPARYFWLCVSLGLFVVVGVAAWALSHWYLNAYIKDVGDRLELLVELRKGAMERYFSTAQAELIFWSTDPKILAAQAELIKVWATAKSQGISQDIIQNHSGKNSGPGELSALYDAGAGSSYSELHKRLHTLTQLFVSERGYYDMFLIGTDGDVYYSVEKESDFGSNLSTGRWRDSGLARVYRRAIAAEKGGVVISDMQAYGPSGGAPAIFVARSMKDPSGEVIGVIALQLPTRKILQIMAYTAGMGDTGETYLVGSDKLMRSNSRFSDTATVLEQKVDSLAVQNALAGKSGVVFLTDYRGVEVMSAYSSLKVGEYSWAIIAEFDRDEIVLSSAQERPSLKTTLLFIYGLALWSVWYWRGGNSGGGPSNGSGIEFDLDLGGGNSINVDA